MVKNTYIKALKVLSRKLILIGSLFFWDNNSSDKSKEIVNKFKDERINIMYQIILKNYMMLET